MKRKRHKEAKEKRAFFLLADRMRKNLEEVIRDQDIGIVSTLQRRCNNVEHSSECVLFQRMTTLI